MNDRELLELAAKAAGYRMDVDGLFYEPGEPTMQNWNPIEDDGDALRLAVKLRLQVTPGTYNSGEFTAYRAGYAECHERVHYQQDQCAATRRAVVRAAAGIGKAMT
jgi:hypothetical protein